MKRHLRWLPAILVLVMIFAFSAASSEESSEESGEVTKLIVKITHIEADEATLSAIDNVVREAAHFTEYFILGVACAFGAAGYSVPAGRRIAGLMLFGVLYAVSDEVHQYFVPGRCFQIQDILVDSAGVIVGILIWNLLKKRIQEKRSA